LVKQMHNTDLLKLPGELTVEAVGKKTGANFYLALVGYKTTK